MLHSLQGIHNNLIRESVSCIVVLLLRTGEMAQRIGGLTE